MKNSSDGSDLRRSIAGRGRPLAVLALSEFGIIESDPGIELLHGSWDGKPALVVLPTPGSKPLPSSYESDLKALHEISFELSLCDGVDKVCRESVRMGLEKLGFDHCGLWLFDQADPDWKIGTWGTDEVGKLCDQRGRRIRRDSGALPDSFYAGSLPFFFEENSPGIEGSGNGRGNRLMAPLWDRHAIIGELGVDDLIGHRGLGPEKREAFFIFSRVVGHLISLKRAEAELKQLASTDSLTGTVNRRTALIILEKHLGQCRRSGAPLTLCLADLDGLKLVNDAFGHAAGDDYICRASATLVSAVRGSDTVGRIGGDEFLIVFPDCRGDVVSGIMDRVNSELASSAKERTYVPRLSWGIASPSELVDGSWSDNADLQRCIDMLLELADQRMYDNKRTKGAPRMSSAGEAELAL